MAAVTGERPGRALEMASRRWWRLAGRRLTYDPAGQSLRAGGHDAPSVTISRNH